jgi:hypothetical protein
MWKIGTINGNRAAAIRRLRSQRDVREGKWKGLDPSRIHFDCGCSILPPGSRAWRNLRHYNPAAASHVCPEHQRALGKGLEL